MNILISGSRDWNEKKKIKQTLECYPNAFIIVGDCKGADKLAIEVAEELSLDYIVFKANWNAFGRAAGPIRNQGMVDYLIHQEGSKLVIAFHEDFARSKGTKNLVNVALCQHLEIKYVK